MRENGKGGLELGDRNKGRCIYADVDYRDVETFSSCPITDTTLPLDVPKQWNHYSSRTRGFKVVVEKYALHADAD